VAPDDTARTASRESAAAEHDAKDLDAQLGNAQAAERSAQAAETALWTAWARTILAAVGAFFLGWTLIETRRTAKAALSSSVASVEAARAADVSAKAAVAAQRPWIRGEVTNITSLEFAVVPCALLCLVRWGAEAGAIRQHEDGGARA
jgi:hypothetical protein